MLLALHCCRRFSILLTDGYFTPIVVFLIWIPAS